MAFISGTVVQEFLRRPRAVPLRGINERQLMIRGCAAISSVATRSNASNGEAISPAFFVKHLFVKTTSQDIHSSQSGRFAEIVHGRSAFQ